MKTPQTFVKTLQAFSQSTQQKAIQHHIDMIISILNDSAPTKRLHNCQYCGALPYRFQPLFAFTESPAMTILQQNSSQPSTIQPTFLFKNGRVDLEYAANVVIQNSIKPIIIDAIAFPDDLGLTFDTDTQTLSGKPLKSGDFPITLHWRHDKRETLQSSESLLTIIPDPNSLWQEIEPPAHLPYIKPHQDSHLIESEPYCIIATSIRGRSHAHAGTFRDDDFYVHQLSNGLSILVAADGAGSAENSRRGSQIICHTFGEYFIQQLDGEQGSALIQQITTWDEDSQSDIGARFQTWFREAAIEAVQCIEQEATRTQENTRSFSSTALVAITLTINNELFAASFGVGDGAIAAYGPTGKVRLLNSVDSGEYAGQTRFLDNNILKDSGFYQRIKIGKWQEISHFIIMTDGVSDPKFETDQQLMNPEKWDIFVAEIQEHLTAKESVETNLLEWLRFPSPGHHDDRTLIVVW